MKTKRRRRNNSTDDLVPVASKPASAAPNVKAAAADPFVDGLSKGMGEMDGGFNLSRPTPATPAVLEAAKDIRQPYVAVANNADNALLDAKGFATPEAAQAWAKGAGDASVYRVAGRDSGGAVKALEPVKPQTQLQPMPAGGASGDNMGNMLRWKPGEAIPEGKAAATGEAKGFVEGLDEGMGGLKGVKEDAPEGIDFAAGGGKVGGEGEYLPSVEVVGTEGTGNASGSVEVMAPRNATPEQIAQTKAYIAGSNKALQAGMLSPTGRVSTTGSLRIRANATVAKERARAASAGTSYKGHVGHVPDTTWTGSANPYSWLDLDPAVNTSIGGQANRYPIGYRPIEFIYKERQ